MCASTHDPSSNKAANCCNCITVRARSPATRPAGNAVSACMRSTRSPPSPSNPSAIARNNAARFAGAVAANAGAAAAAASIAASEGGDHALGDVTLSIPVTNPEKILCIGVNYANRNAEYNDQTPMPAYPSMFFRVPGSFVGHGVPIVRPPESEQLDYEGEIAIVIGEGGRRIPQETAESHIAALTCLNEGTIRDWLRHGKFNVTQGKNFDRTGSIGPWMVTRDEIDDLDALQIKTSVDGDARQDGGSDMMIFKIPFVISHISKFTWLEPGDMIATGSPGGSAVESDPPKWLKPGENISINIDPIGTLSNPIAAE